MLLAQAQTIFAQAHDVSAAWSGGLLCILPFLLFGLLTTVFWIWTIVDCATKEPSEGNDKIIWILVIVLTGLIGSLIYYLVRRPKRIEQYGE